MRLIVLFGPTAAGKTYVGKLIAREFGYYFYDGDEDLTEEMKEALKEMKVISDSMRDRFMRRLFESIEGLVEKHERLVVAQTFLKEKHRQELLARWSEAELVLIKTKPEIRYQRRKKRGNYPWNQAYIKKMDSLFDQPRVKHKTIMNDQIGRIDLISQVRDLVK